MREDLIEIIRNTAEHNGQKIGLCAAYAARCERWFQIELFCALTDHFRSRTDVEIAIESHAIDLAVRESTRRFLIELKTIPCNYGRSGKPITKSIADVVADLNKLRGLSNSSTIGFVAWLAYAIPDKTPATWPMHLARCTTGCFEDRLQRKNSALAGAFCSSLHHGSANGCRCGRRRGDDMTGKPVFAGLDAAVGSLSKFEVER
jgi:hypothetical protein